MFMLDNNRVYYRYYSVDYVIDDIFMCDIDKFDSAGGFKIGWDRFYYYSISMIYNDNTVIFFSYSLQLFTLSL